MSKYDNLTKEELLELIEKQDNELSSKKYGLVWDSEREPEQVVLDCQNNLPILKRIKGKEIRTNDSEDNILIEGDNYHALNVLNYTHQEKIDVIYIDPPYNTGNQDFKYNDKYVDAEDSFRHSKWLNFMEKRLRIAKDLLKDSGILFVSIDSNEHADLKILCDQIFGEDSFVTSIGLEITKTQGMKVRSAQNGSIVKNFEYVMCISKNREKKIVRNILYDKINYFDGHFNLIYSNSKLDKLSNLLEDDKLAEYIKEYKDIKKISKFSIKDINQLCLISNEFRNELYKYSNEICRLMDCDISLSNDELDSIKEGEVSKIRGYFITKVGTGKIQQLAFLKDGLRYSDDFEREYARCSIRGDLWRGFYSDMMNVEKEGGIEFKNGKKPVRLIRQLIYMVTEKDSVILDFFAGSGTTGHAVLELNKEDGGNRKFILCTNNENNICEEVTYPRLKNVINGYKKNGNGEKVEGLGGNLQYFRTDLLRQTKSKDQIRIDLTHKCTEMLCVKENIFNLKTEENDYKIFVSNKGDSFLCIYYNLYDESFDKFLEEIKILKGKKKVYMFSNDGKIEKSIFKDVDDCDIEEIPQKIIDIYKQIVKMNIPIKTDTIFLEFEKANKKIFEDKEKDEGARMLRIVLEKTIQKIAQKSNFNIFKENQRIEKISVLNDKLKESKVLNKVQWEENKTYLTIGNNASHGEYADYDIKQIENFYKHIQSLFNHFGL